MNRAPARSGASAAIESMLTTGTLAGFRPHLGDTLGDQTWTSVSLNEKGFANRRGEYMYLPIESDAEKVMILNTVGNGIAYFNGEPHAGDTYANGYVNFPVLLKKGENHLLMRSSRGPMGIRIYEPPARCFMLGVDQTLPDLIVGHSIEQLCGAVVVINASNEFVRDMEIVSSGKGLRETFDLVSIPPMSVRKTRFTLRGDGWAPQTKGTHEAKLTLRVKDGADVSSMPLTLEIKDPRDARRVTFTSQIDGSVQYFGLRETAAFVDGEAVRPAIVLSCHGASVEAIGQAGAYSPKSWAHIVCPTNRRPYGFDWEDYGRADSMEVLEIAKQTLEHDPARIYVTGHSMGGHGAWHLATTFPDQFAAVGPSAGWISRDTYGGRRAGVKDDSKKETAMDRMMARGTNEGRTLSLAGNLRMLAVYILHGSIDDNVRIDQARIMAKALTGMHHDWQFEEVAGQNHWWSNEMGDGGTACVDWPAMFDEFARHALAPTRSVRQVSFVTANPGISSGCHWLSIEAQKHQLEFSSATLQVFPNTNAVRGRTSNVAVLSLKLAHVVTSNTVTVELDGQSLKGVAIPEKTGTVWLGNERGAWRVIDKPGPEMKNPGRYGSIKDELKHRFMFVVGTRGTPEENEWAMAKARFDAETFWTRGNGSIHITRDADFEPNWAPGCTIVLYGNRDTNAAWDALLKDSPVQARRGEVKIGQRLYHGNDLGLMFIQPRRDNHETVGSVIAIGGSGSLGMRSLYNTSLFIPFVRYPDCMLKKAGRNSPVAAGYFGLDWSVERGEFVFE